MLGLRLRGDPACGEGKRQALRCRDVPTAAGGPVVRECTDRKARLPLGLFDHSGRTLYVASPHGDGRSVVQAIDVASGRVLRSMTVAGSFSTATGDYSAATLSFKGRWLALRGATPDARITRAIV